jgi:hypothetical protein
MTPLCSLHRRRVLAALGALGGGALPALFAPEAHADDYKALVCVFLFGGNDGLNTVVPLERLEAETIAWCREMLRLSPTALRVFPSGSNTITEDVALAVTVSLAEAERLKLHAHTELMKEKKKVLAAIHKRHKSFANDVRLFIDSKRRVLPAGIVLTGGGGQLPLLETDMRELLRLPTSRATLPKTFGSNKRHHEASLTPAIGATLYGSLAEADYVRSSNAVTRFFLRAWRAFVAFLKTLLP